MHGAPAGQDKPTTLPMLDEVLDLAPALEANWAAERAALPPGTLVNDGGDELGGDELGGGTGPDDAPDVEPGQAEAEEESFFDFDPSQVPEDADRDWLGNKYGEMRTAFTQKTQGIGETRREAEESQALIQGLRDPETMPHYLRLLGVDLTDAETLRRFGLSVEGDDELFDELDEPDPNERIGQLEQQIAQDRQEAEAAAELQALDNLADQELEAIEGQWDRKLAPDEDAFLRHQAESNPGQDGLPDYAAASKLLKGILSRGVEHELKRRREPGRGAPGGKPGGKTLDPSKDEDRLALGAAAAERAMASQQ